METKDDFLWGIITALLVLHAHDSRVEALEIADVAGGIEELKLVAIEHGSEAEADLMKWLETGDRV